MGELRAPGQPCGDRGEDVATVKRRRHRLQRKPRPADVDGLHRTAAGLGRRPEQSIVRADQEASVLEPQRHRATVTAHTRIHDRQVDPRGHVGEGLAQHNCSCLHVMGRDAMGDVNYPRPGADGGDHTVADPDEVVAYPVVGQERDHGGPVAAGPS